ncbi:hypothetical protein QQF64_001682 [Cirrhinus molitorella]|uniref:Uncharacterized protein n=1 Tax=Cirrhinus molitorella TaxID=172907 RepID=A0ABR3P119_9TELE
MQIRDTTPILTFTTQRFPKMPRVDKDEGAAGVEETPLETQTILSYIFFSKLDRFLAVVARRALSGQRRSRCGRGSTVAEAKKR